MDGFNEYGCVRVEQIKAGGVAGVARHHVRDYDEAHPAPAHIDPKLGKQNVFLDAAGNQVKSLATSDITGRVQQAKEEHKRTTGRKVRSDATMAIDMVCYRSDLEEQKERRFDNKKWLQDSIKWAGKEFGKENIMGAALHMDEPDRITGKVHPHIHVLIKPGIQTEKGVKLNAAQHLTMGRYSQLQTSYAEEVGQDHGLRRGKHRARGTGPRHVSTHEFQERSGRIEKKLMDRIDKIKDPEKLRAAAKKMAHEVAPGLASQEIMMERVNDLVAEDRAKERQSFYEQLAQAGRVYDSVKRSAEHWEGVAERRRKELEGLRRDNYDMKNAIEQSINTRSLQPFQTPKMQHVLGHDQQMEY